MSLLAMSASSATQMYIEDMFLANTRSGTGATFSVTGGPNMSVSGGMHVTKARSTTTGWRVTDTTRGVTKSLDTSSTAAEATEATGLTAFNTDGATFGADADYNASGQTFVGYFFRNASKFFTHTVVIKNSGSSATVDLSTLGTVGMVKVKRTDSTGSWYVWHRSLTAGKLLIGETSAAEATLGHITVSGTTLTLVDGVIADGTYHVEAYAHDTTANGAIQCGSYAGSGAVGNTITIGFEPQYLLVKAIDSASGDWEILDTSRGFSKTDSARLHPDTSAAETTGTLIASPTATGFVLETISVIANGGTTNYMYMAIRRGPMRFPTSGTQVYQAIARTGTGSAATITGVGFPPDAFFAKDRSGLGIGFNLWGRLTGNKYIVTSSTASDVDSSGAGGDFNGFSMDGYSINAGSARINFNAITYINYFFRRYPKVFDQICYKGTAANKTEAHNLTVAPEFWIVKSTSGATAWAAGCTALANTEYLVPNTTAAKASGATYWNSTFPTSSVLSLGTAGDVNTNTATYVAYLFATLAGISKCFSFTGNGTSQTIDCGFAAGARFVLIKRTDNTGDLLCSDSTRGIVAGNDPHLSLNTTTAEVTTDDWLDPDASGFVVNQTATSNANVNGATYVGIAFS